MLWLAWYIPSSNLAAEFHTFATSFSPDTRTSSLKLQEKACHPITHSSLQREHTYT